MAMMFIARGRLLSEIVFFFTATAPSKINTLSLHDALPIYQAPPAGAALPAQRRAARGTRTRSRRPARSEEHTSELQSRGHLVCRLLLEKNKQVAAVSSSTSPRLKTRLKRDFYAVGLFGTRV